MVTPPVTASMFCRNNGSMAITPSTSVPNRLDHIVFAISPVRGKSGVKFTSRMSVPSLSVNSIFSSAVSSTTGSSNSCICVSEMNDCRLKCPPCTVTSPNAPVRPPEGRASALVCARIR